MQKTDVSHGKAKMGKQVGRRELPCIRYFRALYRGRVIRNAVLMSKERKK
jgi:hypothetical protein